jgi:predicted O-linked N-acetylglucosamine transferase (SPINDLY family)
LQNYMLIPQQGAEPADEWIRLGVEAQVAGKLPDAERHYRQALRIDPGNAVATQNFAVLYVQAGNLNEGLLTIERALIFDGKLGVLHMNRALMCLDADRIDDALASAKKAVELAPNKDTWLALALVSATAGIPEQAVPLYNKILDEVPNHPQAGPNACFVQTLTRVGPEELLKQRQRWYEANAHKGERQPHEANNTWPRPLRVGYVSGDFKCHSASMIFGNVVLHHDHEKVLPYLYSTLPVDPKADALTKRCVDAAGERWRDIFNMTDEAADALIRSDKIDILVDLSGHTNGGRLALFTCKPAPVQVTAWGFAHGTGCPEIDYFFADPVSVPQDERRHYAEQIFDLPCVITYEPPPYEFKDGGATPYQRNGHVTFGSSARYEKLSDKCLDTFAKIMRRVPDSRLRLKDNAYRRPYAIRRVLDAMGAIDPRRFDFMIGTNHNEHMLEYRNCDICLDPFPHGGGIVALEQLYMGVPLVTLRGTQPSGRSGASVLTAMGYPQWIAESLDNYVNIAVALAGDPKRLREARKNLHNNLMNSPVIKGYREAVEAAYAEIWKKHIGVIDYGSSVVRMEAAE